MNEELSTDYEGLCGNCHSKMKPNDKYCKYCGTKKGLGEFKPYNNEMYCVYGPPIKETFKCKECGKKWTDTSFGESSTKFCPECGSQQLSARREMELW